MAEKIAEMLIWLPFGLSVVAGVVAGLTKRKKLNAVMELRRGISPGVERPISWSRPMCSLYLS